VIVYFTGSSKGGREVVSWQVAPRRNGRVVAPRYIRAEMFSGQTNDSMIHDPNSASLHQSSNLKKSKFNRKKKKIRIEFLKSYDIGSWQRLMHKPIFM
jgi:hypothetical protein